MYCNVSFHEGSDPDYCPEGSCGYQGVCTEVGNGYRCDCFTGFTGQDCESEYCLNL